MKSRLVSQINYLDGEAARLREAIAAGKAGKRLRHSPDRLQNQARDLQAATKPAWPTSPGRRTHRSPTDAERRDVGDPRRPDRWRGGQARQGHNDHRRPRGRRRTGR